MRAKALLTAGILLGAAALADVLTGWAFFPIYALVLLAAASLALCVRGTRPGAWRTHRFVLCGLILASFAVHLAGAVIMEIEARAWPRLSEQRALEALSDARSIVAGYASEATGAASDIAGSENVVGSLNARDQVAAFTECERAARELRRSYGAAGVAIRDRDGAIVAWAGSLPNYFGSSADSAWSPPRESVGLEASTAYYWIEAHSRIDEPVEEPAGKPEGSSGGASESGPASGREGAPIGWVSVFRAIDVRYPRVLPAELARTLSEELTRRVGQEIKVSLMDAGQATDAGQLAEEIGLPDGQIVGYLYATPRPLEDELGTLRSDGLFAASLLLLALMFYAAVVVGRALAGPRFTKASPRNVVLLVGVLWGARLGLAALRDAIRLGGIGAFTSYEYASQIPSGILRSPADLAITAAVGVSCVVILFIAAVRSLRGRREPETWVAGVVAVALASGVAFLTGAALKRVLGESSPDPFTLSPFDLNASSLAMKVGICALTATGILLGALLVSVAVRFFRHLLRRSDRAHPLLMAILITAAVLYGISALAVLAGAGLSLLVTASMCLAGGLIAIGSLERKISLGLLGAIVALALASSLVQYRPALHDLYSKQEEAIASQATEIVARTDEWKTSMLDEAVVQVGEDTGIRTQLAAGGRLDSEALRLWATSILSSARVPCGVYIVGPSGDEVGRFSLEDTGDLPEIESAVRGARFAEGPTTYLSGDLYLGVVPEYEGESYVGSVVISIPYRYADLESWAGLKPTFFEQIRSGAQRENPFAGVHSASLISNGKITATTARDLEIGSEVPGGEGPRWIEQKAGGVTRESYIVPLPQPGEAMMLSFRLLSPSERWVYLAAVILANMVVAILVIAVVGAARGLRLLARRMRGVPLPRFRWNFATKLALAFLVIAVVPTLILGTASSGFVRARLREVTESKAEESLNLTGLAVERLVGGEASRLVRNPILMDELRDEPSILGVLVSNDFSADVVDSSGKTIAAFGSLPAPRSLIEAVIADGHSFNSFSADRGLVASSAAPIRDVIFPDRITGGASVSRTIDDQLAQRLSSDLARDITFYGGSLVAASSKRELFVSEIMPDRISSDAFVDCFLRGREIHFTWERIGSVDLVVGYSPLRDFNGRPVGATSAPVVFRKDEVGQRMGWTAMAISYLLAIVIGAIFILGFVLARRISSPIRALIRGTDRAASGDLSFTVPKASDDEIGDLVSSFNAMTAALTKSRNALSERKQYMETIIGTVGAGIISTDWRGRIQAFNSAAETLLGAKAREVTGRDARGVLKRIGAVNLAEVLDEAGKTGAVVRREVTLMKPSGTALSVRAVASVVRGPRQRMMGKVMVFEDLTELIRSKKLVAWSEMARQVAHEIKNPLTPMKLSAQQILQAHRDRAGDFDKILEESLATIIDEIEALRKIAVEFSQFSRMPERKPMAYDLNEIVDESLSQYERVAGGSVKITKALTPSLPRLVVDRDELKRVFINIIENAIQAMPEGGTLEVRTVRGAVKGGPTAYRVSVTSRPTYAERLRDFVEVAFTDTGTGISVENSEKLFEPNFSTKTQGTGLGLAISKGTIDAYGGEMVIESTEGIGTSVKVRLPVGEGGATPPPHPRRRYSRRRRRPPRA